MELVHPTSVVDVGCAIGAWLLAFEECGVARLRGIDGHYVDTSKLLVDPACFVAAELSSSLFNIGGRYDVALCLEVAEHLPERNADRLVKALSDTSPIVLFSAAVPGQGGTAHLNEQWPSYWRRLFQIHGFELLDPIRPKIRDDGRVQWYYRQNLVLFVKSNAISEYPALAKLAADRRQSDIEWVHISVVAAHRGAKNMVRLASTALLRKFKRRMSNLLHKRGTQSNWADIDTPE